jgi:purine-binding chemotaxis protein CheW
MEKTNTKQKEKAVYSGKTYQLVVFKLGGDEYALTIEQIKEVVVMPHVTKVPLVPKYIVGVANVRGTILSIVDLEEKFGMREGKTNEPEAPQYTASGKLKSDYALVVESKIIKMAILVREVPNTLSVYEEEIEWSPSIVNESAEEKHYIRAIVKRDDRLVILIDAPKIISREAVEAAANQVQ